MRVNLNRLSAGTQASVTSPYRPKNNVVIAPPKESRPVMPTHEAEKLRWKLDNKPINTRRVAPIHSTPMHHDVLVSRKKRWMLGLGAAAWLCVLPGLLSTILLGPIGLAIAGGMALLGISLMSIGGKMK